MAPLAPASITTRMSQIEDHWSEVSRIETELLRKMVALGVEWHDDVAMARLAAECRTYGPADAQAAYASHDPARIAQAEFFALVSLMLRAMQNAALEDRDVHAGQVWKSFAKHLYN